MQDKDLPLVESLAIADVYVSGVADIEDLGGGNYRFTWYVRQRSTLTGKTERLIVARNVCSAEVAREICSSTLDMIGRVAESAERKPMAMVAH